MKTTTLLLQFFLLGVLPIQAQNASVALKTIRINNNNYIVKQEQIKGGFSSIDGIENFKTNNTHYAEDGMVLYDTSTKKFYRFSSPTTTEANSTSNSPSQEEVRLISEFNAQKAYKEGDLVVAKIYSGDQYMNKRIFQALKDITPLPGLMHPPADDSEGWKVLGQSTFLLNKSNSYSRSTSQPTEFIREKETIVELDQSGYAGTTSFPMPEPAQHKGETWTLKNKRSTVTDTNNQERATAYQIKIKGFFEAKMEGQNRKESTYYLHTKDDHITFISDGEFWFEIGGNVNANSFTKYNENNLTTYDDLDGIYFVSPDETKKYKIRLVNVESMVGNIKKNNLYFQFYFNSLGPNKSSWHNFNLQPPWRY